MKKLLLTASAAMFTLTMMAQPVIDAAFYTAWSAKHNTKKAAKVVLDFSTDSTLVKEWNADKAFETSAENEYKVSYDATEKAVKISFKYLGTAANDHYSGSVSLGGGYKKVNDSAGTNTNAFNPFQENDSIVGTFVDFSNIDNRQLRVTYKMVNNNDSASMRIDLYDVNGRKTNSDISAVKKQIKQSTTYGTMTYTWGYDSGSDPDNVGGWNEDALGFADGYSGDWWGIKNGHWNLAEAQSGLPNTNSGGQVKVDLDSNYVLPKFLVQFNGGGKTAAWVAAMAAGTLDKEFEVYIQKVEIGDLTATGTDVYTYPATSNATIVTAPKVAQNGNVFTFSGSATLVNVLGQAVATGVGSIDASGVAAGIYFIVIDGVAKEVSVK